MSRRNGAAKRFPDRLVPSTLDAIQFCIAIEQKFLELCKLHRQHYGTDLLPPPYIDKDMLRWRTMRLRHRQSDWRNTDAEFKSLKTIAQWLLDVKCDICNQPRIKLDDVIKIAKDQYESSDSGRIEM